ncbi:MAG TPA: nicotinate-nicotinamide nucleotide adenylyltransferase [Desulfurobacteriaceae bacterium]|nr:nicotinate-nicotinamide nucleotide adenylyltransferase [Desulfurobacteriaceae bacterium]
MFKIFFALTEKNPLKNSPFLSYKDRFNLLKTVISNFQNFFLLKESYIYAIDLVLKIKKLFKNFYFILGLDSFLTIEKWKNYENLLKICNFIVCSRDDFDKKYLEKFLKTLNINKYIFLLDYQQKYIPQGEKVIFLKIPRLEISSTLIKKYLKLGLDIYPFVPEKVWLFLKTKFEGGKRLNV